MQDANKPAFSFPIKVEVIVLIGISEICHGVWEIFFRLSAFWINKKPKKLDARDAAVECNMERIAGLTDAKLRRLPFWCGCMG